MTKQIQGYYNALRQHHGCKAQDAYGMARDYAYVKAQGVEFVWEEETDSPRDVFGEPDPVHGPFYDPNAEFYCCLVKSADGKVLDSLGMIEGPWATRGLAGYWLAVECDMASNIKSDLMSRLESAEQQERIEFLARVRSEVGTRKQQDYGYLDIPRLLDMIDEGGR